MADVSYLIDAQLRLSGGAQGAFNNGMRQSGQAVSNVQAALNHVGSGFRQIAGGVSDVVERVISTGTKIAAGLGAAGVVGGLAMAKGIGENLSMLEDKSISMGSVMAAATGQSFATMKEASKGLFAQFETDAVTAAGSTADFVGVANSIAGPVLGAGKSMAVLHDLTKSAMDAAGPLGISYEQMGSSVTMLLQGMATAHDPLFRAMKSIPSLGIKSTESFQAMSQTAKIAALQAALGNQAFRDGAVAMGQSWTGLRSTLADVFARAGKFVGLPMFERAKRGLSGFNDALIGSLGPGGNLAPMLASIGQGIESRFGDLSTTLRRIFPDFMTSGEGAVGMIGGIVDNVLRGMNSGLSYVADHWGAITDGARAFATAAENGAKHVVEMVRALGGGDLGVGLTRVAELMAAKKVADASMPIAGGAITAASGMVNVARLAGVGAGAGGAEAATGGLGAAAAAAGPAIAVVAGAIATLGAAFVAFQANIFGLADYVGSAMSRLGGDAGFLGAEWDRLTGNVGRLMSAMAPLVALYGAPLVAAFGAATDAAGVLIVVLGGVAAVLGYLASAATAAANEISAAAAKLAKYFPEVPSSPTNGASPLDGAETYMGSAGAGMSDLWQGGSNIGMLPQFATTNGGAVRNGLSAPPAPKHGGGGGAQKVEVTIKWDLGDGNEDAIFVKSRKDIGAALRQAKQLAKSSTLAGAR